MKMVVRVQARSQLRQGSMGSTAQRLKNMNSAGVLGSFGVGNGSSCGRAKVQSKIDGQDAGFRRLTVGRSRAARHRRAKFGMFIVLFSSR